MIYKKTLTLSIYLALAGTVSAAPATTIVKDINTLTINGGAVNVNNQFGISALDNDAFTYMGDISVIQNITAPFSSTPVAISIFNSIANFGKTDVVVNIDSGVTGSYVTGLRLKNGSAATPELAATITAELGAGSTITLNGNDALTLYGVNLEGGPYTSAMLVPDMKAYLNEDTTITLNNAGKNSAGIYAYIAGTEVNTKDGLTVNVNTESNASIYGVRSQGGTVSAPIGGTIALNGTSVINLVNGGSGSTGILANASGSTITGSKEVTINNTTADSTATLYGAWANGGNVNFQGPTNVTLTGGNATSSAILASQKGELTLTGGTINALNARAFYVTGQDSIITGNAAQYDITGSLLSASGGVLNLSMADSSTFTGISELGTTPGTTNLNISGVNSLWNMTGDSTVTSLNLYDGATVNYVNNSAMFKNLTVTGNYHGDGGYLSFNTVLGDDTSATDKLIVEGDTSGNTFVKVNNAGGSGAQTLNGIELITVAGTSGGEFIQDGRIVAGAYDYYLGRGEGSQSGNWYLNSGYAAAAVDPGLPDDTVTTPTPGTMVERPEASGYSANLAAANNMFVTRLHDRLGETQYIDALTGEQKVTSLWLRNEGGHNRSRDTQDQLSTQSNRYVVQLGGDIAQWSNNGLDRFHLGVMAGYGNSKSRTESQLSGYSARASVDGYSTGIYGTWYANDADKTGLYVDSWAQYSWFNNTVNGQGLVTEEYKSKGITASVESGYTFKVGENAAKNATYFIQPKAQITRMGVKANDHTEANGTKVSGEGNGNIQTRLGVKAFMNGYADQDKDQDRMFQPFVETNWIHNTKDFGTTMNGISVKQDGAANIAELKLGVEGQLSKKVNVWANVGQQVGSKGYSDTAVMLGVKYNF
ncbi:autotransporter protein [Yersinia frederiksenii]|uniref:Autotransporter protein n=2 Tax=Yersinia frederiksenii TaxID=29484 RepID=A0A380PRS1_YERFR|nr:autotransporter outer membrane beta-barrel domain-containing protein [Yersinia frederiksenii]ATM95420.1 autotransporter outer membrane beta-barrel domain-containing protein [Yersinia frederiksenii]EEQ14479.1 Type V secretory pathway, adhesin AidA [Yersinia frederiksenii ATCC 33641]KGA47230.1 outer membrane autotransporter barrel domain protein [Yersinia frederiksenii ATCC 33641]SUP75999.1 autotransporter protein [Yersinia frederiksenii]